MTVPAFLDTSIVLRHILQDHPERSARASALLATVKLGEATVHASETVIFESVYVLEKRFGAPKDRIAAILNEMLTFRGLVIPNREALSVALTFWSEHGGLSFADCFHLALADRWGLGHILTFDQKMDRFPGVTRIEP